MNRIKAFFLRDHLRKLLALIFAVLLYFGVHGQIYEERSVHGVPVDVKLAPELSFITRQAYQVMLTVRGAERALKDLNPEAFAGTVYVGPEHFAGDGNYVVYLRPDMFTTKPGVKIVNAPPLKLHLQRRISRRVPVKTQFSGRLPEEYRRAEDRVIPAEVIVSGPEMTVKSLNALFTEQIPLSETVTAPFEYESRLVIPSGIQVNLPQVMVQVDVVKNFETRRLGGLPVHIMHDNSLKMSAALTNPAQTAEAVLSGVGSSLSMLKSGDIRIFADLSNIHAPGNYMVPLRCSCSADGVSVKAVTPGEVEVKVVK